MAKRLNPGSGDGLPIIHDSIEYVNPETGTLEFWTIYDRGDKDDFRRWKLSATDGTSVLGTANYALNVKGTTLYTNDGGSKLRKERPELFAIVAGIATGIPPAQESLASDEEDPYGDLALSRGRKLTQLQNWNRALLRMREYELHWLSRPDRDKLPAGVIKAPSWEVGARVAWFGIFRDNWEAVVEAHKKSIARDARLRSTTTKPDYSGAIADLARHLTEDMPPHMLDDAIAFITRRGEGNPEISYDAYMKAMKDFHAGLFKPLPMAKLAEIFDLISGYEDISYALNGGAPATEEIPVDDFADLM